MSKHPLSVTGQLRQRMDDADAKLSGLLFAVTDLQNRMTRATEYHAKRGGALASADVATILRDFQGSVVNLRGTVSAAQALLRQRGAA